MKRKIVELEQTFSLSEQTLLNIRDNFARAIEAKNQGLSNIPTFIRTASGKEEGVCLAIDFGGTNIRVAKVSLSNKSIIILRQQKIELQETGCHSLEELFMLLARILGEFAAGEKALVGHTFSFPVEQISINKANFLHWTKEIKLTVPVGTDINGLLNDCLQKQGYDNVQVVTIINDTVAVLLANSYLGNNIFIGTIWGTGHNSCYYDFVKQMVINLECGNFNNLPATKYDLQLDLASQMPGKQQLEKQVSGRYLLELVQIIAGDLLVSAEQLSTARDLSIYLQANKNDDLSHIIRIVIKRARQIISTEQAGIIKFLSNKLNMCSLSIGIDGALYRGFEDSETVLNNKTSELAKRTVRFVYAKDISLGGAAVSALLTR